jgi:hypothetical protein
VPKAPTVYWMFLVDIQIVNCRQNRQVNLPIAVPVCPLFHRFTVALPNEKPDSLSFIVRLSEYDISSSSKSSADGLILEGFKLRTFDDTNEILAHLSSFPDWTSDKKMPPTDCFG